MQPEFWRERWATNQIGFHEPQVNPLLVAHVDVLALPRGARVLLPLCGMTLDIDWLLARGLRVAGAELSAVAVEQLFERLDVKPVVSGAGALERWSAAGLDVFVGDFFSLAADSLGHVDAVYDRAALIALPPDLRHRYVVHLNALSVRAPQLLITLDYDQQLQAGPPFSVPAAVVAEEYGDRNLTLLASADLPGGLKGKCAATESVWKVV